MIRADNEMSKCMVFGDTVTVVSELANLIYAIRDSFAEVYPEEAADELITLAGKYAYSADDDEKMDAIAKRIAEIMDEVEIEGNEE